MMVESGSKPVMIGDSVTDQERGRPAGEGLWGAIGKSYVGLIAGLLEATYPERRIRVVNMGGNGDNTRNLKARWETDVFDLKPDWLSIMIGVNDVWRQFDTPLITESHVNIEKYRKSLESLVAGTLPRLKGMVLMTPYYMEPNKNDAMRATMDKYGEIVKEISSKYNTLLIDTQAEFDQLFEHFHSSNISWDRIHPNITGHMVIARAFLKVIGYKWD